MGMCHNLSHCWINNRVCGIVFVANTSNAFYYNIKACCRWGPELGWTSVLNMKMKHLKSFLFILLHIFQLLNIMNLPKYLPKGIDSWNKWQVSQWPKIDQCTIKIMAELLTSSCRLQMQHNIVKVGWIYAQVGGEAFPSPTSFCRFFVSKYWRS